MNWQNNNRLHEKNKVNQNRVIKLLIRYGAMNLEEIEELFNDVYEEPMPFYYIGEKAQHDWMMCIENVAWDVNKFKFHYTGHQRSKSAPYQDDDDDNNEPCSSTRQSRIDKCVNFQLPSEFSRDEPSGLSTPIEKSPEKVKKVVQGPSCLKKNFSRNYHEKKAKDQGQNVAGTTKRKTAVRPRGKSENRVSEKREIANLFNIVMIGDDFPLGVVMLDNNFPHEYEEKDGKDVLCCGYCMSGLTIKDATECVEGMKKEKRTCIVYLGSMDIILGKNLPEMEKDFKNFIQKCHEKILYPVLCTLAPIPTHQLGTRKMTLLEFNHFLEVIARDWGLPIIDINKTFVKQNGSFEEYCYAVQPRAVSGLQEWIAPWSKIGRTRFQQMIKKNIGNALMAEGFVKLDSA